MSHYDLIVIGAGPGGYVAAEEAGRLGKTVALIERKAIGGTCLNVGCIPSKSYLSHSHWLNSIQEAKRYDMDIEVKHINFPRLVDRKNDVVKKLQQGIHSTLKANNVDYLEGEAVFINPHEIEVNGQRYTADYFLLSPGSHPFIPPISGLSETDYLTTDTFFAMTELPERLVIIGGGVIAIELAFAMQPLGVQVTVIEVASDILLTEDGGARSIIKKKMKKMGMTVETGAQIIRVESKTLVTVQATYPFDQVLVATGRKPNLDLIQQLQLDMDTSQRFVEVDEHYRTSVAHIYAAGDVIGGYLLAHTASAEGIRAVHAMFGQPMAAVNQNHVPRCVYTSPEIASFGMSETQAKQAGYDTETVQLPFAMNGRAIAQNETEGFAKIISAKPYGELLGAVLVAEHATEMIHTLLGIVESEGTLDEVSALVYAHPTLSEMLGEVSLALVRQRKL